MKQKNGANYIQAIQKVNLDEEKEKIQNDKEGLVRVVRVLAFINSGTGNVDSNNVRTDNNTMNITGFITGLVMLVAPSEQVKIVETIWKGAVLTDKAIIKSHEGTWGASVHEEKYQIIKDGILIIGGIK